MGRFQYTRGDPYFGNASGSPACLSRCEFALCVGGGGVVRRANWSYRRRVPKIFHIRHARLRAVAQSCLGGYVCAHDTTRL
jgi:hypothetical protein